MQKALVFYPPTHLIREVATRSLYSRARALQESSFGRHMATGYKI